MSELSKYTELQSFNGGLATITDEKLALISERMVEVDRVNHTAGRSNTQVTNQLMTLTMLNDSPYRRLRQCLAQIEDRRKALDDSFFRMKKSKLRIEKYYEKGDELSVIKAQEIEHGIIRNKDYIDGAFKELAVFQEAYEEIRESNNIPIDWDEKDAEKDEVSHHIRQAFRQSHRDMVSTGTIGMGNMEYLEQFGIHPQTAKAIIGSYIEEENKAIKEGHAPTVVRLYNFLDNMVDMFKDAHKEVMKRIGIKNLIRDDFLYLEGK